MGRRKLGETTALRITLPPDAPPDMVELFKKLKGKKPMDTMQFLYKLYQGQVTKIEQELIDDENEDDFEDMLADFMPS